MPSRCLVFLTFVLSFVWTSALSAAPPSAITPASLETRFQADVLPVLEDHCFDCHDSLLARGGHDFEAIGSFNDVPEHLASVIAMGKAMRHHTMPPPDQPQPTVVQREAVDQWMRDAVRYRAPGTPIDPGAVTLRRLNRTMYANTLRDLLYIDQAAAEQVAATLPADDSGYGFDHIGDVLSVSPLLLERYLVAAEKALDAAFLPADALVEQTRNYAGHLMLLEGRSTRTVEPNMAALLSVGTATTAFTAPITGEYEITITAHATRSGDELARADLHVDGTRQTGFEIKSENRRSPDVHRHRLTLEAGQRMIGVRFPNNHVNRDPNNNNRNLSDRNLYVHGVGIRGPVSYEQDVVPRGQRLLFEGIPHPKEKKISERASAARVVQRFTQRAFRRPVKLSETVRYVRLYETARKQGARYEEAVRLALSAVMVAPEFLFLVERHPDPTNPEVIYALNDHEIASRLSYFLWSSMPDEALMALADTGQLSDASVRQAQVQRMLADPKAAAFVENFTGQWLQLRNLDLVHPDPDRFGTFSDQDRRLARREVELFFADVVRHNRPITDLVASDHVFVNAPLAEKYGLPQPEGATKTRFVRVDLPENHARGGVLTSAAVLTVTSHAARTSPVKRGLFMLENILGAAPPPAPPDVPQIDESPAAAQDATLRERLEAHLTRPDCRACHMLMDPIGYSLESFDAIGRIRSDDEGLPIDDNGELPDGARFQGPQGLKNLVIDRRDWFAETFTEKLMVYALGRGLEPEDEAVKIALTEALADEEYRINGLIEAIVNSDPFLKRRGLR